MGSTAALLLASALAAAEPAITVEPAVLTMDAGQASAEVWVRNDGDTAWAARASLHAWRQAIDGERLEPAGTILISPSHFSVPAGSRQRLRVLRPVEPVEQETGYRLLLEQLPASDAAGAPLLRHSSAVFVTAPDQAAHRLLVRLDGDAAHPALRLHNAGAAHARVTELAWVDPLGRRHLLLPGLAGYVLAGASRIWSLPPHRDGYAGGHFEAQINQGPPQALEPDRLAAAAAGPL